MIRLDESQPDYFVDDDGDDGDVREAGSTTPSARTDVSVGRKITFDNSGADALNPDSEKAPRRYSIWRRIAIWLMAIGMTIVAICIYLRYFNPYVTDGRLTCYVLNVEKRGVVFKTYEADVVSEQSLMDNSAPYSRQQSLSVDNEMLAKELQKMQGKGRTVELKYKTYNATVPWRGASKWVVTEIATE